MSHHGTIRIGGTRWESLRSGWWKAANSNVYIEMLSNCRWIAYIRVGTEKHREIAKGTSMRETAERAAAAALEMVST